MDKSTWERGPWDDEPDRVEWRHSGRACLARRNGSGVWCGYVALPPGHPMHGVAFDNVRTSTGEWVGVHGGLSYSGPCDGAICHTPLPGESDNVWWVGFDCGHGGDRVDFALGPELRARWAALFPTVGSILGRGIYRDLAYVRGECERLAEQL